MENSARLFHCARCHHQVIICSDCDRGNLYCSRRCSRSARLESLRAAGKRYQTSLKGKHHHAKRQRRYRARIKKVTHQRSLPPPRHDVLPPERRALSSSSATEDILCHFCHRRCALFLRLGFLRHGSQAQTEVTAAWPSGP